MQNNNVIEYNKVKVNKCKYPNITELSELFKRVKLIPKNQDGSGQLFSIVYISDGEGELSLYACGINDYFNQAQQAAAFLDNVYQTEAQAQIEMEKLSVEFKVIVSFTEMLNMLNYALFTQGYNKTMTLKYIRHCLSQKEKEEKANQKPLEKESKVTNTKKKAVQKKPKEDKETAELEKMRKVSKYLAETFTKIAEEETIDDDDFLDEFIEEEGKFTYVLYYNDGLMPDDMVKYEFKELLKLMKKEGEVIASGSDNYKKTKDAMNRYLNYFKDKDFEDYKKLMNYIVEKDGPER